MLIEELRKLGNETLGNWGSHVGNQVAEKTKQSGKKIHQREKKTLKWWSTFGLVCITERIWRGSESFYIRPLPEAIGMSNLGYSRKLQRALCDFGMEQSFAKAKDSIKEHYGFESRVTLL